MSKRARSVNDHWEPSDIKSKKRRIGTTRKSNGSLTEKEVSALGDEIPKAPRNYNSLVTLLSLAKNDDEISRPAIAATCRALCMLWLDGRLTRSKSANENETTVCNWLHGRSDEFENVLAERIRSYQPGSQQQGIALYMQLVRAQLAASRQDWVACWTGRGYFKNLVTTILSSTVPQPMSIFLEEFVKKYDDVMYFTYAMIPQMIKALESKQKNNVVQNVIVLMESLVPPADDSDLDNFYYNYTPEQKRVKRPPRKVSEFRKQVQPAILSILSTYMSLDQRKTILRLVTANLLPWMQSPTRMVDFLTDSFNTGGAISLLALSGMYELMTTYNLDYPSFYRKLYLLLDANLLHSAHRSKFFRLLNQYLASSHLPAAMVASFTKRLSRLALHGPPAGIVAMVPFVYNVLQMHPQCTFMIHREPRSDEERALIFEEGAEDPFDMAESDPMATRAIDSCLWELETLQYHFHPNVASLTKVIAQEFRKQSYNLEDFLDHSYSTLVAGDLGKEMKKAPVVDFQIPKKIFTTSDGDATLQTMMTEILI